MPVFEPKGKSTVKIENVVASASLEHRIDIKAVAKAFPTTKYQPKVFPGLVFRLKRPKTATLIFSWGKMVCTGARKEEDVHQAVNNLRQKLEENDLIYFAREHKP